MRQDTDLSLAVGDWTRRNANRGRHLSDRHRHEFEEECERLAAAIQPRAVRDRLEPAEETRLDVYRRDGRGWKLCDGAGLPLLLQIKGLKLARLRRGRSLPEFGEQDELFLLMITRTKSRQLVGGMLQFIGEDR